MPDWWVKHRDIVSVDPSPYDAQISVMRREVAAETGTPDRLLSSPVPSGEALSSRLGPPLSAADRSVANRLRRKQGRSWSLDRWIAQVEVNAWWIVSELHGR